MAQRVQVLLVCDVHDDDTTPGTETISFSLDGTSYEIDVCDDHADELRDAVAPYVGAGRRVGGARGGRRPAAAGRGCRPGQRRLRPPAGRRHPGLGQGQGLNVNERGRIPATIVAQYEASALTARTPQAPDLLVTPVAWGSVFAVGRTAQVGNPSLTWQVGMGTAVGRLPGVRLTCSSTATLALRSGR